MCFGRNATLVRRVQYTRSSVVSSFKSDIRLTFFRHGDTEKYEEVDVGGDLEALTEEGMIQVLISAVELAQGVKKNNEVSLIWTSPRKRTIQTAQVLADTLHTYGAIVLEHRVHLRRKCKVVDMLSSPNLTQEFWDMRPEGESFVPLWRELSQKRTLPKGVESYDVHVKRVCNCIVYAQRMADVRKKNPNCPRMRIIAVCHFETVTPILQAAYGEKIGVAREKGLRNAEYLHIDIQNIYEGNVRALLRIDFIKGLPQDESGSREVFLLFDLENNFVKVV